MPISRLYHTLRPLRWQQYWYRFFYPLKKLWYKAPKAPEPAIQAALSHGQAQLFTLPSFDTYHPSYNAYKLLNIQQGFELFGTDWNAPQQGLLWAYHLNYFNWLKDEHLGIGDKLATISSYILAAERNQLRVGLDAYPISLRGINWIRFFITTGICEPVFLQYLYQHYHRLCAFPEYHLQANHLWENGCSLFCAGLYFREDSLYQKGKKILQQALNDQLFSDGGHVEGSPVYHSLLLERLLQCIELAQQLKHADDEIFINTLRTKAAAMLGWLQEMTYCNNKLPMVNDSAYEIAPDVGTLSAFARSVSVFPEKMELGSSGYRMIRQDGYELFIDMADILPAYQPGHAHADTFSFCLGVNGQEIITDPGISTYEDNPARHWERSTNAHNTISIGQQNSSDVWKSFRTGKRAKVITRTESAGNITVRHDGFKNMNVIHCRSFTFLKNKIIIEDTLEGRPDGNALLCLHFHKGIVLKEIEPFRFLAGNLLVNIEKAKQVLKESYSYAEGFNKTSAAERLCISLNTSSMITLELLHAD